MQFATLILILFLVLALLVAVATTWLVIRLRARTLRRDTPRTGNFLGPWRWHALRGHSAASRPRRPGNPPR